MRVTRIKPGAGRQRGVTLVVGLIFLSMLSLMGVAAYMVATQEERMSGNTRDRIRAFEAAEASLRDCEAWLAASGPAFDGSDGSFGLPLKAGKFDPKQAFKYAEYSDSDWKTASKVRVIPAAIAIPGVALQPRCIVQEIGQVEERCPDCEQSGPQPIVVLTVYQITARGYGVNESTRVDLQTIFRTR